MLMRLNGESGKTPMLFDSEGLTPNLLNAKVSSFRCVKVFWSGYLLRFRNNNQAYNSWELLREK